jgi:hypothetical protein
VISNYGKKEKNGVELIAGGSFIFFLPFFKLGYSTKQMAWN